jgi:hypothetical protein
MANPKQRTQSRASLQLAARIFRFDLSHAALNPHG